ncbi:hypothetical protein phiCT453A_07 (endogenous virus) [Clostridium phage phiCT453A]|uniref:hypothetical protein n=1 Tax=Clostridium phage phiCT453A TaxID=1567012 RepID=UPI000513D689|nr:hypothetical protein [Clostridium tetani]YP_009216651.1 hypothetical protein phiCT453A_07 [Clostridium phage phiCT453A]AJA42497.1 hypothetical protein phiCT453A_07 [Clostridium phage phiCT453A]KGI42482.1 hypothetical protein KY55_10385 [Clostridium tetani]RXM58081.1 hypothetical protein DP133_07770 [Clostridium tetani]
MNLKNISTEDLIKELISRKNVEIYNCGLYGKHEAQIKRKYTQDRDPVKLPLHYKLIVVE